MVAEDNVRVKVDAAMEASARRLECAGIHGGTFVDFALDSRAYSDGSRSATSDVFAMFADLARECAHVAGRQHADVQRHLAEYLARQQGLEGDGLRMMR